MTMSSPSGVNRVFMPVASEPAESSVIASAPSPPSAILGSSRAFCSSLPASISDFNRVEGGGPDDGGRGARLRHHLDDLQIERIAQGGAAIGFRHEDRVQAERSDRLDVVPGKFRARIVARRGRRDHIGAKPGDAVQHQPLLLGPVSAALKLLEDFHVASAIPEIRRSLFLEGRHPLLGVAHPVGEGREIGLGLQPLMDRHVERAADGVAGKS